MVAQDPAEWERTAGVDTLATLINADLQRQRQAGPPAGIAVTEGDVTETFLPQSAFEVAAMPQPPAIHNHSPNMQQPSPAKFETRSYAGRQAHAEIRQSLKGMPKAAPLPTPQLDASSDFVRSLPLQLWCSLSQHSLE